MKFIRGIYNLEQQSSGCVLTIGNFDGVHRGHQALLSRLIAEGRRRQLPVMVMLFEPHPLERFAGANAPARLTRLHEKIKYLQAAGVDKVLCIRFNLRFAALSAEAFITDLLLERLNVKLLVVGDDFRFGAERRGDFTLLSQAAIKYGFDVVSSQTFYDHKGERVSSTAIRRALTQGDLVSAERLLGRPFSLSGRVVHGDALGRTIGFPTANVLLRRTNLPVKGVYAVSVSGLADHPLPGVANIGTRPTVDGRRQQLEVHLLDFDQDLYGCYIDVTLCKKIRDEQRFASLNELTTQIAKDEMTARHFFGLNTLN